MSAIGRLRISPSDIGRRITVRHLAGADLTTSRDSVAVDVTFLSDGIDLLTGVSVRLCMECFVSMVEE